MAARISLVRSWIAEASPLPSTMVVVSLVTFTWRAVPRSAMSVSVSSMFSSLEMTVPPVRMAISRSISFRRSPKPGALTQTQLKLPRSRFTSRVARASPSTSSAMMIIFRPVLTTFSSTGRISWMEEIFLSVMRIYGSSRTASILSVSVTM